MDCDLIEITHQPKKIFGGCLRAPLQGRRTQVSKHGPGSAPTTPKKLKPEKRSIPEKGKKTPTEGKKLNKTVNRNTPEKGKKTPTEGNKLNKTVNHNTPEKGKTPKEGKTLSLAEMNKIINDKLENMKDIKPLAKKQVLRQDKYSHLRLSEIDQDRMHRENCQKDFCSWCRFADHKVEILKKCRVIDTNSCKNSAAGSWVETKIVDGEFYAGCMICHKAKLTSVWARLEAQPTRIGEYEQHGKNEKHLKAVEALTMNEPDIINGAKPPPTGAFQKCLAVIREGKANGPRGIKGVGKGRKVRKFKFCLAEGHRIIHRMFLKRAKTLSLQQDVRASKLHIRYSGCDEALNPKAGSLGEIDLCKQVGNLHSIAVADGTNAVIRNYCTRKKWAPFRKKSKRCQPKLEKETQRNVKRKTGEIVTDAAPDETRAAKLLKDGLPANVALKEQAKPQLPLDFENVQQQTWDRTHALRRLPSGRPVCGSAPNPAPPPKI